MTDIASAIDHGTIALIPLSRLKASPKNARTTPHGDDAIAALAGSIAAKGMLQAPVVEPELTESGEPTGFYLVTIGEGRRQAMLLRAKRKEIRKSEPVRCVIDTENDAHEISLDENVTRTAMHPADQFEAFNRLATERGLGAEEIGARFGISAAVVRQRLKLAAVSPTLMKTYRDGDMSLEQLMAFTVTDDHARQDGLWPSLQPWDRDPSSIRRHLTRDRVSGRDRRAVFVGSEAYEAAGGHIEHDLFAPDHGGYFTDLALLDRLALEKLTRIATPFLEEGWKWAVPAIDFPNGHGMRRVYAVVRAFTDEEQARVDYLNRELEAFGTSEPGGLTEEQQRRYEDLSTELAGVEAGREGYDPADTAISGVFVMLSHDGSVRIEPGFVRPEDEMPRPADLADGTDDLSEDDGQVEEEAPPSTSRPLSEKLVGELTAHRTAALRDQIACHPEVALTALLHALTLRLFDIEGSLTSSCLDLRIGGLHLASYAPDIDESIAGRSIAERHHTWATRIASTTDLWAFLAALPSDDRMNLLAHCLAPTVNAVRTTEATSPAHPAEALATAVALDMSAYWRPTAETFFSRVSKAIITQSVSDAISPEAAQRLTGAKKDVMVATADELVSKTSWLPALMHTHQAGSE